MLAPVRNRRRLNACPNLYFCSGTCRVRVDQGASEAQGSQPVRALGTSREDVRSLGSGRAPRARRAYRTLGVEFRGRRLPLRPSRSALSHHPVAGTPMSEIDRSPASHSPHDRPADTQCPPTFFAPGGKGSDPFVERQRTCATDCQHNHVISHACRPAARRHDLGAARALRSEGEQPAVGREPHEETRLRR